jgi:hypothetical protein
MSQLGTDQHLSEISTHWTQVLGTHAGQTDAATAALGQLLQRYCGVAYRYLSGGGTVQSAGPTRFMCVRA